MAEDLTPRQREFGERFAALMSEFHDVVGPVDIDDETLGADAIAELPAVSDAMMTEWLIMTTWTGMQDGKVFSSKYCMPGMPHHHQLGMVTRWWSELMA